MATQSRSVIDSVRADGCFDVRSQEDETIVYTVLHRNLHPRNLVTPPGMSPKGNGKGTCEERNPEERPSAPIDPIARLLEEQALRHVAASAEVPAGVSGVSIVSQDDDDNVGKLELVAQQLRHSAPIALSGLPATIGECVQ